MRLYMKQKVFSMRDNFDIYDSNQESIFTVESKLISLGRKSTIFDANTHEELAQVKQRLLQLTTTMDVFVEDKLVTTIKKKLLSFLKPKYEIENLDWTIEGDFWGYNYNIIDNNGNSIASIRKKVLSWSDTFEFDINEENADIIIVMAVIIAIDTAMDADESS